MMDRHESTKRGGAWLGAVHSWIQWNCGHVGSTCTWGSNDVVKSEITVKQIEEIGAEAVEADRRDLSLYPLCKMLVFDPKLWNGKDVGDNSQFWKEAFILREYGEWADVLFIHDGRISNSHTRKDFKIIIPGVQEEKKGDGFALLTAQELQFLLESISWAEGEWTTEGVRQNQSLADHLKGRIKSVQEGKK